MGKRIVAVVALAALIGCNRGILDPAGAGALNQRKLFNLEVGMSKAEVLEVMGTTPYEVATGPVARQTIENPLSIESFPGDRGERIEVIHYVSSEGNRIPFQSLRFNSVPIVLINGKLAGWGAEYYGRFKRAAAED